MKCICMYIDRGTALIKNGSYNITVGTFRKGFSIFGEKTNFYIPENFRNIVHEKKRCPIFIIDAKSSTVLNYVQNPKDMLIYLKNNKIEKCKVGVNLTAEYDPTVQVKLNVLIKGQFWAMLARALKEGILGMIIKMIAGYGLFRFIEYLITVIFT